MFTSAYNTEAGRLPAAPALAVGVSSCFWNDGRSTAELSIAETTARLRAGAMPFVCHRKAAARRLGVTTITALDVLELFAFVRPARFCVPTPRGLCRALLLTEPGDLAEEAVALPDIAAALLAELQASPGEETASIAAEMATAGWPWSATVLATLGVVDTGNPPGCGYRVWQRLRDWEDHPPPGAPDTWPVEPVEARARLVQLLGRRHEVRPQQLDYASAVAAGFAPREHPGEPRVVLADAGTGVGKTLGYIAPAQLWAQKNHGAVWLCTYTRNLQRQLDQELDRAYPDQAVKRQAVVVRKGRENTICLLNYEEAVQRIGLFAETAVALGLVGRWIQATRDGDMVGGDFPSWLADLLGREATIALTDTRGECIYAACRHYRKCFIEKVIRRARRAEIVVANHALVLVQAARVGDETVLPTRYVFDEGHHLFDACDNAFALELGGREGAEMRRWLRGREDGGTGRRRGLLERAGDLAATEPEALDALREAVERASVLPGPGWRRRLLDKAPVGAAEVFLACVHRQVTARSDDGNSPFGAEVPVQPPVAGLIEAATRVDRAFAALIGPLQRLSAALLARCDVEASTLDMSTRQRIDAVVRGIDRRATAPLAGWRRMLASLDGVTPAEFVDWLAIDRLDGTFIDVAYHRRWLDPMRPFVDVIGRTAHGYVITSATLKDESRDAEGQWTHAAMRTGITYLPAPATVFAVPSPFDYPTLTRVFVITDVDRMAADQVAAAYRELFRASGGGALGLFTAIGRLRGVFERISRPLADSGLRLLAQHVDVLDTGTLIDIFRAEEDSCLLGTDAVRDGVDVPGRSLRLIVFDRVPWPRPTILHRARREAFGNRIYDEALTRLRLKQAFGRLVRRADDRGCFVILDRQMPSRLATAFPPGVAVERVGLADAIAAIRDFLHPLAGTRP